MNFILFINIFVIFIQILSAAQENSSSIELVHVFFRHGSRTIEEKDIYPNDIYKYKSFSPFGYGQLTNLGKQRAYNLGKLLRRQYNYFMETNYNPEIVYATSTDFDRTKMTALLVLAGLFPPSEEQKWNDQLHWLPIPYHYEEDSKDFFIRRPTNYCPAYVKELERILLSKETQSILEENKEILEYISKHAGKPYKTLLDVFGLNQVLNAEDYMNLTLPRWTNRVYPGKIHQLAAKQCELENKNLLLKRLNGGRSLSKAVEQMKKKVNGTLSPVGRKMYLYSGHENNVINILSTLNLFDPHVPKYSAAVMIELHRLNDESHAVKIYYAKHINTEPKIQKLPDCDELCPFDKFLEITAPYLPLNYTKECESEISLD